MGLSWRTTKTDWDTTPWHNRNTDHQIYILPSVWPVEMQSNRPREANLSNLNHLKTAISFQIVAESISSTVDGALVNRSLPHQSLAAAGVSGGGPKTVAEFPSHLVWLTAITAARFLTCCDERRTSNPHKPTHPTRLTSTSPPYCKYCVLRLHL